MAVMPLVGSGTRISALKDALAHAALLHAPFTLDDKDALHLSKKFAT